MYSNSSGFHMCCYCEQGIILITWTTFIFYLFSYIDVDFLQVLQLFAILSAAIPIYQQSYPFFSAPAQGCPTGNPANRFNFQNSNGFGRQFTHHCNQANIPKLIRRSAGATDQVIDQTISITTTTSYMTESFKP